MALQVGDGHQQQTHRSVTLEDSRRRTRSKNNEEWSVPEEEPATWLVKDRVMEW